MLDIKGIDGADSFLCEYSYETLAPAKYEIS
jgi:hypothetical protein